MPDNPLSIAHPDFYPFFTRTADSRMKGFFYDIITEAVDQRMDIRVSWTQLPWKRCQKQVQSGVCDAMITVPTNERSSYSLTHTDPFYLKELKLFTYKGHPRLDDIQTIASPADIKKKGYTVITYSGNGWNHAHIASIGILSHETSRVHNVWVMLAAKRGDIVIEWPIAAKEGIMETGMSDKIFETCVSLESMPFHLLISKKSKFTGILSEFNQVINEMHQDGTIRQIISTYY